MFRAAAPAAAGAGPADRAGFGLVALAGRRWRGGDRRIDDPFSVRHFTDLTRGYRLAYRPELAGQGGNTFTAMAAAMRAEVGGGDGVELAVVAHATPDLDCRLAVSTYLSSALPDLRLSFAVSEAGSCAPHTALRLAAGYAARHGCRRALVLLLEQATLPYEVRLDPDLRPAGDAAVALLLTADGTGAPVAVRQRCAVPAADVPGTVRELARGLAGPGTPVRLVDGSGLAAGECARAVGAVTAAVTAPAGYRATGTWGRLAAGWSPADPVATVLVDHDRPTGDLSVCLVGPPAGTP